MINLYVANTDNSWFDFLAAEQGLTEVNFWWPGETAFRVLQPGEILAFRLKSPRNKIGGFGIFSSYSLLPIQMAWETFGRANGVSSLEGLRKAIAQFRTNVTVGPSTHIGSTVLVQPVFFPSHLQFDVPESWSRNVVRGKHYSTDNNEGLQLWRKLVDTAEAGAVMKSPGLISREQEQTRFVTPDQARFGTPTLITPRLGQGAFRVAVTEAYGRQCAVTDGKVLPALDAAHIKPYAEGGEHLRSNGILLRKDIHSVFDAGYVTIKDDLTFSVSKKVKEVFNNGEEYLRLHGRRIRPPKEKADWPDMDVLRWHNKERYLG
jgi:putative restriction endonuclease